MNMTHIAACDARRPHAMGVSVACYQGALYVGDTFRKTTFGPDHRSTWTILEIHPSSLVVRWTWESPRYLGRGWVVDRSWETRITKMQYFLDMVNPGLGGKRDEGPDLLSAEKRRGAPRKNKRVSVGTWFAKLPKLLVVKRDEEPTPHDDGGWKTSPRGWVHPLGHFLRLEEDGRWVAGYKGSEGSMEGIPADSTLGACRNLEILAHGVGLKPTHLFRTLFAGSWGI